jgi:isopenicillin N synthase-like dioxygenase
MRHGTGEANPWPVLSGEYFEANSKVARVCLAALARGLCTAEENLVDKMMDPVHLASTSSTIFRFFHYLGNKNNEQPVMGCLAHTDIGLITLIPATNCAALQILDQLDYRWKSFEDGLGERDMMVLCGETLERLSAFCYPAVVRVFLLFIFNWCFGFCAFEEMLFRFTVLLLWRTTGILWSFCFALVLMRYLIAFL